LNYSVYAPYFAFKVNIFFLIFDFSSAFVFYIGLSFMKTVLKIAAAIAVLVAVQYFYGLGQLVSDMEAFAKSHNNPFFFFVLMSVGCAVGVLPLSFCTLYAGAAFGALLGSVLSVGAICLSSIIGYSIGRFFCPPDLMEKIKQKFHISAGKSVFDLSSRKGMFDLNFFVRAVPGIPYCMQNFILGGMNSEFKVYMILGVSIQGLFAVAMNVLGASFNEDGFAKYLAIVVLVVLVILIRVVFKRFFKIQ